MNRRSHTFTGDEGGTVLIQYLLVLSAFALMGAAAFAVLNSSLATSADGANSYQQKIVDDKLTSPSGN